MKLKLQPNPFVDGVLYLCWVSSWGEVFKVHRMTLGGRDETLYEMHMSDHMYENGTRYEVAGDVMVVWEEKVL